MMIVTMMLYNYEVLLLLHFVANVAFVESSTYALKRWGCMPDMSIYDIYDEKRWGCMPDMSYYDIIDGGLCPDGTTCILHTLVSDVALLSRCCSIVGRCRCI